MKSVIGEIVGMKAIVVQILSQGCGQIPGVMPMSIVGSIITVPFYYVRAVSKPSNGFIFVDLEH
jgi:hypothetical protein